MNYFLMPDYYKDFSCKKGDCRFSCCKGWKVTFSLKDYFKLVSEECSEELRNRLDKGVKISLNTYLYFYIILQILVVRTTLTIKTVVMIFLLKYFSTSK